MIRYRRRYWFLAAALSAVAGFVDAVAFVHLGGFFVSFMSGNSTRLGVGLAGNGAEAALAAGLVAVFILGVILGTLTNRRADRAGSVRVTVLVAITLALAATLSGLGATGVGIALLALAMGAENAVFQRDGEVSIGLTYMTGTLVRAGQRMAAALLGGPRFDWLPYLLLWAGLVAGACTGAATYAEFGLASIWAAAAASGVLALVFATLRDPQHSEA